MNEWSKDAAPREPLGESFCNYWLEFAVYGLAIYRYTPLKYTFTRDHIYFLCTKLVSLVRLRQLVWVQGVAVLKTHYANLVGQFE